MPERLPIPVSTTPAEARLASVLFDIDSIAARAQQERDLVVSEMENLSG